VNTQEEAPFDRVDLNAAGQEASDFSTQTSIDVAAKSAAASAPTSRPGSPRTQDEIFAQERERIAGRRKALDADFFKHNQNEARGLENTVGLALSGGGIRSATISLGILRALSGAGLLKYVDYISSVSGGSYIASFVCSRYVPSDWRGDVEVGVDQSCTGGTGDPFAGSDGEHALDHLRQSGRHLLPGHAGDAVRLAVVAIRSWLAVHLVLGVSLLAFFLLLKLPQVLWLKGDMLDLEASWVENGLEEPFWPSLWMRGYRVATWCIGSWLIPVAMAFLFVAVSLFSAYFLTRGKPPERGGRLRRIIGGPGFWVAALIAIVAVALLAGFNVSDRGREVISPIASIMLAMSLIALGGVIAAEVVDAMKTTRELTDSQGLFKTPEPASPRVQEDRVRYLLTNWTTWWLSTSLFCGALAFFDSVAQTIYVRTGQFNSVAQVSATVIASIPIIRKVLAEVVHRAEPGSSVGQALAKFGRFIALICGLIIATTIGVFWATIGQWLAWWGGPIGTFGTVVSPWSNGVLGLTLEAGAFVVLAIFIAFAFSFLNLSTFANFYASSLRRAYLGASNIQRWMGTPTPANADHIDDDIALDRYYASGVKAPLHLINVTVNDTASRSSNTTQRDRRGKPLTISPSGYLYPSDGARGDLQAIPFAAGPGEQQPEKLALSTWIGISGAAASTGLGQYGSLGLSLLAGLANLRLGYWWDPGEGRGRLNRGLRAAVQSRLADELMGRFPGTDGARWYLTDGGHFENTGAYELIRRRCGLIVLCDNGGDAEYNFGDLVTLTRRVRIDFDAELRFIEEADELDRLFGSAAPLRKAFGTIGELGMTSQVKTLGPYAALGRIRYAIPAGGIVNRSESTLMVIKPRVCGMETPDLVAYARAHPPFPQQTTIDQTFDEAQWESYYRLGQIMGDRLFASISDGTWNPNLFKPLPPARGLDC